MYNWRRMTPEQRAEVLRLRQQCGQPWHGPTHGLERHWYHLTAACYEHQPILGASPERMVIFERELLETLAPVCIGVQAWCLLPNHYHLLLQGQDVAAIRKALGRLHGRSAHRWNQEDHLHARTCWHRCSIKPVRSEAHHWATANYIHHNPVHHGYARGWQDWPFSSAARYLAAVGREVAERIWRDYPLLDYGKGWDEPWL